MRLKRVYAAGPCGGDSASDGMTKLKSAAGGLALDYVRSAVGARR